MKSNEASAKPVLCTACHQPLTSAPHFENDCLKEQLKLLQADRNVWKEAWWKQREATGRAAWQYDWSKKS